MGAASPPSSCFFSATAFTSIASFVKGKSKEYATCVWSVVGSGTLERATISAIVATLPSIIPPLISMGSKSSLNLASTFAGAMISSEYPTAVGPSNTSSSPSKPSSANTRLRTVFLITSNLTPALRSSERISVS